MHIAGLELKCMQLNLQRSMVAKVEIALTELGDVYQLQEPHIYTNRIRYLDVRRGNALASPVVARVVVVRMCLVWPGPTVGGLPS